MNSHSILVAPTMSLGSMSFAYHLLHIGFLLGLFFDPEDRGTQFLSDVG
jgi:hypothetical protein